ncbi:unnamed protein product [Schistosoma curassoni]|uniref:Uncharacterized protein n=1 Tax=Schistosoma curassoni TaxID=6186 RepID=A0A183KNL3_9TREM|nr:unnamed protein product [Schistosoma curassoni]
MGTLKLSFTWLDPHFNQNYGRLTTNLCDLSSAIKKTFEPLIPSTDLASLLTCPGPLFPIPLLFLPPFSTNRCPRQDVPKTRPEPRSTRSYQNDTQRSGCQSTRPQFVHSYSIFETGIGCITKPDRNTVELCETKEAVLPQTEAMEFAETESNLNPLNQCEAFVTDIKQLFKNPPIIMHDSAAGQEFDLGKINFMYAISCACSGILVNQ